MKKLSLLTKSKLVYESIEQQIEKRAVELENERKWIEWAFCLAMNAWFEIEKISDGHRFANQAEEILFYKTLKPEFMGLIEYLTLLYKSVVFQPDDPMKRNAYWKREIMNCSKTMALYQLDCMYYEQQPDANEYFLKENNQQSLVFELCRGLLKSSTVSYSCLLGRLIAVKKHKEYIQAKYQLTSTTADMQCIA